MTNQKKTFVHAKHRTAKNLIKNPSRQMAMRMDSRVAKDYRALTVSLQRSLSDMPLPATILEPQYAGME